MASLLAILGLNASSFKAGLDQARKDAKEAGHEIASALGEHVMEGLAGAASLEAVKSLAEKTVEYGEQVSLLSQRLGISTEAVQAWDFALKQSGSSVQSAVPFFEKLALSRKKALEGNAEQVASFKALGVTLDDLKGKRLEDLGAQISEAFKSGDPQQLIADLRLVGGRGAGEMVAAFRDGLVELTEEAKERGLIIGESTIDGLRDAADKSKAVWQEMIADAAPFVSFLAKLGQGLFRGVKMGVETFAGLMVGGTEGAKAAAEELQAHFDEQDKAAEERNKRRHDGITGGAEDETNKKALRDEKKAAEDILRLREQLAKRQEATNQAQMTAAEKLEELERQRAAGLQVLAEATDEKTKLKASIGLEEIKKQILEATKELDKESEAAKQKGGRRGMDLNSSQRIGAYASDPIRTAALDIHKKNESHLRTIKDGIQKLVARSSETEGTQF